MTKIIYDTQNLIIDVRYDRRSESVLWSIQNVKADFINYLTSTQIKTLIGTLQKSLDFEWEPQT